MFSSCILRTIEKTKTYRIYEDFYAFTKKDGIIRVPMGFITDLGTIPEVLQSLVQNNAPYIREATILHDWLYSNKSNFLNISKSKADSLLIEGMEYLGANDIQCLSVWSAVSVFGYNHWKKD